LNILLYAAVLVCFKPHEPVAKIALEFVYAHSRDEAYGKGMQLLLQMWPTNNGYRLHNVYVRQVPEKEDF
jgi:hypothetical protein